MFNVDKDKEVEVEIEVKVEVEVEVEVDGAVFLISWFICLSDGEVVWEVVWVVVEGRVEKRGGERGSGGTARGRLCNCFSTSLAEHAKM